MSPAPGRRRLLAFLAGTLGLVALGSWAGGCYEGMPPTMVIPSPGSQPSFLPDDFAPGTQDQLEFIYYYDQAHYAEYRNEGGRNQIPAGTNRKYIKRGSVLSIIGATTGQIARPDTVDATLAQVYGNPELFGFEPAVGRAPGFDVGQRVDNSDAFMPPCFSTGACGPTWWSYNHVQFQWARKDTVIETTTSPTSGGATTWRLRSISTVRDQLKLTYLPSRYEADWLWSVMPGTGIFLHGMTLTAERYEVREEGTGQAARQRNPVFLWLSAVSLPKAGSNPNVPEYTTLDQCLDGMWGDVLLYPLQLAGPDFQVGKRFVTWTYVAADSSEIRRRVERGNQRERNRCSGYAVPPPPEVPMDSPAFAIYFFDLLTRYEVSVERLYDVLEWRSGNNVVGEYGARDGIIDVVKLKVLVNVVAPDDYVAQQVDLYLMRGIGLVVQQTGVDVFDISRLREATVDGQYYPPSFFKYADQ